MNMPKIDTNSIVSILLAIVMAFTSMGGLTANIEDTVSFDAKISLDAEAIMALSGQPAQTGLPGMSQEQDEEQKEILKVVGDIISSMTLRGVASRDAAEAVFLVGDSVALSLGVKKDDAGVTVASSLLPNNVVFFSSELIQQAQDEMEKQKQQQAQELQQMLAEQAEQAATAETDGPTALINNTQSAAANMDPQAIAEILEKLDTEQIAKDIEEAGKKLTEGFEAKKGETETGEFTVDDMTFVSKTPVNMTYPEMMEFLLISAKELAAKESLKPLLDATGKDIGAEIDKAIEELKNQSESDWPETFELAVYADADNCTYCVNDMAKQSEAGKEELHIAYGDIEGQSKVKMIRSQGEEKMTITAVGAQEGAFDLNANIESKTGNGEIIVKADGTGNFNMTCNIKSEEQDAKIVVSTEKAEGDRMNIQLALWFGNTDKPMFSFGGSFGKGGELVSVFEGEKITSTAAGKLMDSESKESGLFGTTLIAGVLKTVMVVAKNVPEETGNWITTKIREAMTPQTKKTETPTEQPVVDGE